MISGFVSWGLWLQFLPEMCAIYKVSRRKIERGVSWPVRQKASEACNLFLLQAGSIRPSPLGAIHLGDGHIYFLRYINMFGFRKYWIFGKYFHSTQAAPDQQVSFPTAAFPGYSYVTSGKIYPRKKFLIANLCYLSLMLNALYWCSSLTDDNNVVFLLLLWWLLRWLQGRDTIFWPTNQGLFTPGTIPDTYYDQCPFALYMIKLEAGVSSFRYLMRITTSQEATRGRTKERAKRDKECMEAVMIW